MEKELLLKTLKHISDAYFDKKDYISAGQINRAIDVLNDYDGVLPQSDVMRMCFSAGWENGYSDCQQMNNTEEETFNKWKEKHFA